MSNRLFQGVINQMKDVIERTVGVIDENGIIIACSESSKIGESRQRIREELSYSSNVVVYEGVTYRFVGAAGKNDCIAFVDGNDGHANKMAQLVAIALGSIKGVYDERYDKGAFIKNIILDNILPSDIYTKSNELHFGNDEKRAVIVFKFASVGEISPDEIVLSLVPDRSKDYVINIGDHNIVVVKELDKSVDADELIEYTTKLVKDMQDLHDIKVYAGISSIVDSLNQLARAYKEARISLEVGKVFDTEKIIMSYEGLGIGRLVYQLPTTLCEIFLSEVFKKGSLESLDRETLMTVQAFFKNNLNVSETSRKLFVHRNTLVYRLEKIRKLTGLDLREFDNAVTFKVALMVKKYLASKPTKF